MSNQNDKQKLECVILYLLGELGASTEGKKKIMKLVFLLDHYNNESGKLNPKSILGNDFFIYNYGVFSIKVMDTVNTLIKDGRVMDGFPLKKIDESVINLDEDIKKRIDLIVEKFGKTLGYKLEVETLRMLGFEPHEKGKFFGKDIADILKITRASS